MAEMLRERGLPHWSDEGFSPELAATRLYPHAGRWIIFKGWERRGLRLTCMQNSRNAGYTRLRRSLIRKSAKGSAAHSASSWRQHETLGKFLAYMRGCR